MKTLYEKYYNGVDNKSAETSSFWKECGDNVRIIKKKDCYELIGFGFGELTKNNFVKIIKNIPVTFLLRKLLREHNANHITVNMVNKILKNWNTILSFGRVKNLLSFDLINSHGLFNQKGYICIIGDGYGFFGTLLKMIHPKAKIIFINLGKILPFDVWYFASMFPEINPLHLQSHLDVNTVQRHSVIFLEAEKSKLMRNLPISLFLNIASFSEMDMPMIQKYFEYMRTSTIDSFLYCCNRAEKKLPDGSVIRFSDFPWDERDKVIVDELCPWYYKYPISRPPFWKQFEPICHRLVKLNRLNGGAASATN